MHSKHVVGGQHGHTCLLRMRFRQFCRIGPSSPQILMQVRYSQMGRDDALKAAANRRRTDEGALTGELELLGVFNDWISVRAEVREGHLFLRVRAEEGEEGTNQMSGEVKLADVRKLELLPSPLDKAEKKAFTLYLETHSITLKAESAQQAAEWMKALDMASMPSGSSEGEGSAHTVVVETIKDQAPLEESDKGAMNVNVPTTRPESTEVTSTVGPKDPVVKASATRTPVRTSQSSGGDSGVRFVGAYNPRSTSGGRSNSERRHSRGEAWRQKENMAPIQVQPPPQRQQQQAYSSVRYALFAEGMGEEASVQVEKRGAAEGEEGQEGTGGTQGQGEDTPMAAEEVKTDAALSQELPLQEEPVSVRRQPTPPHVTVEEPAPAPAPPSRAPKTCAACCIVS